MKISDLMTHNPITCPPSTNLAAAAALMLQGDCGILPVVDNGKLRGVVTDRDLFIALGTRDQRPSTMTVGDVMHGPLYTCTPDDDLDAVLEVMKEHAIRRLPVEGFGGTIIGIVSMNDVVRAAGAKGGVRGADVVETLQAICAPHHPALQIVAA